MSPSLRPISLLLLGSLTACGSIPTRTFEFDVIGVDDQPQPCLIVVNDNWVEASEKKQVVNVAGDDTLSLTIPFPSSEVEITVAPMKRGGGEPKLPKSRKEACDTSGYMDEVRKLQFTDPRHVLFILPKRRANS